MRGIKAPNGWKNNASVFEGKGNPWVSQRDQLDERMTRHVVKTLTDEEIEFRRRKALLLNEMHSRLGKPVSGQSDYTETITHLDENPDWDMYFAPKARPPPREDQVKVGKLAKTEPRQPDDYQKRVNQWLAIKARKGRSP